MMPIKLQFQYTEADFNEFLWHYVVKGRGRRMFWWMLVAIGSLGFTLWFQGKLNLMMMMVMGLVFVLFSVMWRWLLLQSGKKTFKMNTQMQEKRRCTIKTDGLDMLGESFEANYEWKEALRIAETIHLFLMYTSPRSAVILPKRAFSPEQTDSFRAIIAQNNL